MFTVYVPEHLLYDATTFLQHNQQYVNREYYRSTLDNGYYTYTFSTISDSGLLDSFIRARTRSSR